MTRCDKRKRSAAYVAGSMVLCNMSTVVFDSSLLPTVALLSLLTAALWVLCPDVGGRCKRVSKKQTRDDNDGYVLV